MKKIPGIDRHVIVKDIHDGMIKLRGLCMVQECTTIQARYSRANVYEQIYRNSSAVTDCHWIDNPTRASAGA